jgi:hypothetical protein
MINLDIAQEELNKINLMLQVKCPELSLELNYYKNLRGTIAQYNTYKNPNKLLLCLYYQDTCISSIEMLFNETNNKLDITINSKTTEEYRNRKYNKFLRSVAIYVSRFITIDGRNVTSVVSQGVNEITIWQMITYFNATYKNEPFNESFVNYMEDKPISVKEISNYFNENDPNHYDGIVLRIDLTNTELFDKNRENIMVYMNEILCVIIGNKGGKRTKKVYKSKARKSRRIKRKRSKTQKTKTNKGGKINYLVASVIVPSVNVEIPNGEIELAKSKLHEGVEYCGKYVTDDVSAIQRGATCILRNHDLNRGIEIDGRPCCDIREKELYGIVWHTHPNSAKFYPSLEDILMVKKIRKNEKIKLSVIYTSIGIWLLESLGDDLDTTNIIKNKINQINKDFYFACYNGRTTTPGFDLQTVLDYINTYSDQMFDAVKMNIRFEPYSTGQTITANVRDIRLDALTP